MRGDALGKARAFVPMTETLQRLLVCFSDFAFVFFFGSQGLLARAQKKAVISPRLRAAFLKAKLPLGSVYFILARRLAEIMAWLFRRRAFFGLFYFVGAQ